MAVREILRDEWVAFFDDFSREHRGERATIDVNGPDGAVGVAARDLPFVGVSADLKDGEDTVEILTGEGTDGHIAHGIARVQSVRVVPDEEGTHNALEIAAADGSTTRLTLEPG